MKFPRQVYAIQHNVTGRIYIGSSENVTNRYKNHVSALRRGNHVNKELQKDFDSFGENYSLYVLDTIEDWEHRGLEQEWMYKLNTIDFRVGYNGNDPKIRAEKVPYANGIPTPNIID